MKRKFIGKCLLLEILKERVLCVGDLHLGFEEQLNRSGVFVSRKIFEEIVTDLDFVFSQVGKVDEIILLGDVKHEFGRILRREWKEFEMLMNYFSEKTKRIVIVRGNHDKIINSMVGSRKIKILDFYKKGMVVFMHGDRKFEESENKEIKLWILGHAHPAVKIGDGVKVEKYKCFLEGNYNRRKVIILPSFTIHNEGTDLRERDSGLAWDLKLKKFKVYAINEINEVYDFGELGKL